MKTTEAFSEAPLATGNGLLLTGSTARDAIIRAVVGEEAGAIVGLFMDQQAEELSALIRGADVERLAEGILVTFPSSSLYVIACATLRPEARRNLRKLAVSLQSHSTTEILIVGHTDAIGDSAYKQDLSKRRASAVFTHLASEGVATSRMHAYGRGQSEPLVSNGTESGRQSNRRLEVAIYAGAAARAAGGN
jgi:outer membrane protein OmpA-like peptidoglycan-associated protein